MRLVKVGIANIDTKVKAFKSNTEKALAIAEQAVNEDYSVICYPEQTFFGYSPEDLVEWTHLVNNQLEALMGFVSSVETRKSKSVHVIGATIPVDSMLYNCAVVVQYNKILGIVPKQALPNYNVFYE